MSAVPKKKLCWNCEGNVSRQIDNCPYCGVYLHADELEENSSWNPSYRPSSKTEEIPSPIYQIQQEPEAAEHELESEAEIQDSAARSEIENEHSWLQLSTQLKRDVFPILFLMMGSIFFLFGIVLFLFSQNGTLILQWQESSAPYFLFFSIPLIGFGWWYLQKLEFSP
jgi:hypothetical protein